MRRVAVEDGVQGRWTRCALRVVGRAHLPRARSVVQIVHEETEVATLTADDAIELGRILTGLCNAAKA